MPKVTCQCPTIVRLGIYVQTHVELTRPMSGQPDLIVGHACGQVSMPTNVKWLGVYM